MNGWEIKTAPGAAALTARQVARAIGTSETTVAAYERGDKIPKKVTRSRIDAATAAGATSTIFTHNLMTVPALAAVVRTGLRESWKISDLLRLVRESRSNAKWVWTDNDRALFFARPATTGDPRWDALIAGSTEDLLLRSNRPAPAWTTGPELRPFWFVGSDDAFDAYALAHSPACLKVRGVMIDPAELESV